MLIVLLDFTPIKPDFGLIMWTTIFFCLFWFIIGKFAYRPIIDALESREGDIQSALDEAKKAREEMAKMQAQNETLLAQAREERAQILKQAKETKSSIIEEAKGTAKLEAQKIVGNAKQEIDNQKNAAIIEVKNKVGMMAIEIAEKVMKRELKGSSEHESYVNDLVKEIELS